MPFRSPFPLSGNNRTLVTLRPWQLSSFHTSASHKRHSPNHYETLNITSSATPADVKKYSPRLVYHSYPANKAPGHFMPSLKHTTQIEIQKIQRHQNASLKSAKHTQPSVYQPNGTHMTAMFYKLGNTNTGPTTRPNVAHILHQDLWEGGQQAA